MFKYNQNSEDSLESLCEEFVKLYLPAKSRNFVQYDIIDINYFGDFIMQNCNNSLIQLNFDKFTIINIINKIIRKNGGTKLIYRSSDDIIEDQILNKTKLPLPDKGQNALE